MTFLEALAAVQANPRLWACPKGQRGIATCYEDGRGWLNVPGFGGGAPAQIPPPGELHGEWEVLDSEDFLIERKAMLTRYLERAMQS